MGFFDGDVLDQDKNKHNAQALVDGAKVVLVYFSAEWCPPCKSFTPKLKDFYEHVKGDGVVIFFSSCDQNEDEMFKYFNGEHGLYHVIPFDADLKEKLQDSCKVSGIPSLCVVDKEGNMKYSGCRSDVEASYQDAGKAQEAVKKFIGML